MPTFSSTHLKRIAVMLIVAILVLAFFINHEPKEASTSESAANDIALAAGAQLGVAGQEVAVNWKEPFLKYINETNEFLAPKGICLDVINIENFTALKEGWVAELPVARVRTVQGQSVCMPNPQEEMTLQVFSQRTPGETAGILLRLLEQAAEQTTPAQDQ